tara:strand:- start:1109 stop:1552 length:444 start_codon:yes stop_codon:yes gene_type:complete
MSFINKIKTDMYSAMKEGDKPRSTVLRSVLAKLKDTEINKKEKVSEKQSKAIIKTMIKQRKESVDLYLKGGREELANIEKKEIKILETYMPKMMGAEETKELVLKIIKDHSLTEINDIGKLMGLVMKHGEDAIDGKVANKFAQELLL